MSLSKAQLGFLFFTFLFYSTNGGCISSETLRALTIGCVEINLARAHFLRHLNESLTAFSSSA